MTNAVLGGEERCYGDLYLFLAPQRSLREGNIGTSLEEFLLCRDKWYMQKVEDSIRQKELFIQKCLSGLPKTSTSFPVSGGVREI